jgi:hypothetical protein
VRDTRKLHVVLRWVLPLAALLLAVGGSGRSARAAGIDVSLAPSTLTTVTVPFESLVKGQITLVIKDLASGEIDLWPPEGPAEERERRVCRLTVVAGQAVLDVKTAARVDGEAGNKNCQTILTTAEAPLQRNVSARGSTAFTTLDFEIPGPAKDSSPIPVSTLTPLQLPDSIKLQWTTCYVNLLEGWRAVDCQDRKISLPERWRAKLAAVGIDKLYLAAKIDAGHGPTWHRIELRQGVSADDDFPLAKKCQERIKADAGSKQVSSGDLYVVCADVAEPSAAAVTLQHWDSKAHILTDPVLSYHIPVRVPVVVYAFYVGAAPEINGDGNVGFAPVTYVPKGIKEENKPPPSGITPTFGRKVARNEFGPQLGPKLTVNVKIKLGDKDSVTVSRTYVIQNQYWTALRVGLGLSWSPWAREVGVRSTSSGAKYTAITDGDGPVAGLFAPELVVSYSYFLGQPMPDDDPHVRVALNLGVGALRAGSSGVSALSSVRGGLELAYGLDFSLVVAAGINQHNFPKDGYQPGNALPNSADTNGPTRYGVTPGFGVVLNLTPTFLKTAGILAGGG